MRIADFMGNGRQALSLLKEHDENALRFAVDNDDVFDRRDDSFGWSAYSRSRYHVGISPVITSSNKINSFEGKI